LSFLFSGVTLSSLRPDRLRVDVASIDVDNSSSKSVDVTWLSCFCWPRDEHLRSDDSVTPENKKLKKNNSTEDLDLSTRHSPRNKSSKFVEKNEKSDADKLLTVTNNYSSTKRQNSPSKPSMSPSDGGVSTRKQKRK
jgi:hypothetical protein